MADDDVVYLKLCKLRELFSGRYSTEEIAVILNHNDGHLDRSVTFILSNEPQIIRQLLENERNTWTEIEGKTRRMKSERAPLGGGMTILDRAKSGQIDTESRLFSCQACDKFWWRRTPGRKKVSRCNRCRKKYDPVPRNREWGWAEFACPICQRQFGGWCAIYMKSPCYGCESLTAPTRIVPTGEMIGRDGPKRSFHACAASDCPGRAHWRGPVGDHTMICVHPASRRMRGLSTVITASGDHDSSGSTVDTFLSQTDLTKHTEEFFPSLHTIHEVGDGDNVLGSNGVPAS